MSRLFKVEKDSVIGLDVVEDLKCEYKGCNGTLVWWGAKFLKFSLNESKTEFGHACDIIMICPECGLLHVFGHPISSEHWEHYKKDDDDIIKRDGKSTIYQIGHSDG